MTSSTCGLCREPLGDDRPLDTGFAERHPAIAAIEDFPAPLCTGCANDFDGFTNEQIDKFVAEDADFGWFLRRYFTAARKARGATVEHRATSALTEYLVLCRQDGELPCDCGQCPDTGFGPACAQSAFRDYEEHFGQAVLN